jgi:hypothetical protein
MTWRYSQSTGRLYHNGELVGVGYSGLGSGKNRPEKEDVRDLGPIPRGHYRIGKPHDTFDHGPHVMRLTPIGHNARRKTGFLIHGDKKHGPLGIASTGCIVVDLNMRRQISGSNDDSLEVIR